MAKISAKAKEIKDTIMKTPTIKETIWVSTGQTQLDEVFGAGKGCGIESGQIVQIYAKSQAGKTFIAMEAIASAVHNYGDKVKYCYNATEDGNTFDTEEMFGFSLEGHTTRSVTVEEWFIHCKKFCDDIKDDEIGIYVVDSVDGMTTKETQDRIGKREVAFDANKSFDEGSYGTAKSKLLSTEIMPTLRNLATSKNCIIVLIHQTRQNLNKVGGMGANDVISGSGEAVGFYSDTRVFLKSVFDIKKSGRDIGYVMVAEAKKSRGHRGYRKAFVNITYSRGIENVDTNLDYLFNFKTDGYDVKANAEAVWEGIPDSMVNIKQFTVDNGYLELFLKEYKNTSPKQIYLDWIMKDETMKANYLKTFGIPMSRQELILYVETNNLEEELIRRCKEKWEQEEQEAIAHLQERKPRFQKVANANT